LIIILSLRLFFRRKIYSDGLILKIAHPGDYHFLSLKKAAQQKVKA